MSDVSIPAPALQRLRLAYQQFLDLAQVTSDAMGISPDSQRRLDLERGLFVVEGPEDAPNGHVVAGALSA